MYEVEDYMHLEGAGLDGETAGAEDEDTVMTAKAEGCQKPKHCTVSGG